MEVKLGASVMGTDGKLGEVSCVTYDPHTHTIDDLIVRHGKLLAKQHVVPLNHLARADGDAVYTDLDTKAFEALDEFSEYPNRLRDADPRDNADLSPEGPQAVNLGMGTYATDPMPDTRLPQFDHRPSDFVADDQRMPLVKRGTPIYDVNGERIGEVHDFSADSASEQLSRVQLKRGLLFGHAIELPIEWIDGVTVKGISLRVSKDEVQRLAAKA